MEPSKRFSESQRKEVYSQAFNNMFYGYGDRHFEHCWALFGRDNDDICWSYFKKKGELEKGFHFPFFSQKVCL